MNITKGQIPTAKKVVIYGPEGIGKSTFAAQFPGAVFLDTEAGTTHMDVSRFDPPVSWGDVLATVDWCIEHHDRIGTFVLDTIDWAERLAIDYTCDKNGWKSIEDPGYGKGYVYLKDTFRKLLDKLTALVNAGTNVVLVAHSIVRKFELPDAMGAFDRWSLKVNEKNVAPLIKEWADALLFVNFRTDVVTDSEGKKKARGSKRVLYATHNACWDAKNRFGLPDEMPFSFESIAGIFEGAGAADDNPSGAVTNGNPSGADAPPPLSGEARSEAAPAGEAKGKRKKAVAVSVERPAAMTSGDPEKDAALSRLWVLMKAAKILSPLPLQAAVAAREFYPADVQPKDYDTEFITDVLIEAWDSVLHLIQSIEFDLPF